MDPINRKKIYTGTHMIDLEQRIRDLEKIIEELTERICELEIFKISCENYMEEDSDDESIPDLVDR